MDYSDGQQARWPDVGVERVGPYTLIAEICAGEFTTIHLGHKPGGRLVAVKRLKPAYARQPEWSQLLLDEARLGASVVHPNTVDVLDVGTDAGVYVVMDYVEGSDLESLLLRAGRERHPRYVVPPLLDALSGLQAIHTQLDELGEPLGMVHQAPRARHILVGIHGSSCVTDYSQVTARGLIPTTLRGKGLSPGYMAPEQVLLSEPVSARTDVFIAGITLWEALTGMRLFDAETPALARRAITERDIPRPSDVGLKPPRCFDDICARALQRNPELRYQSAQEFAQELREVAQEQALLASASELGAWVRAIASGSLLERRRAMGSDEPSIEIDLEELEARIQADRESQLELTELLRASGQAGERMDEAPAPRISRTTMELDASDVIMVEDGELEEHAGPPFSVPVAHAHDGREATEVLRREPTQVVKRPPVAQQGPNEAELQALREAEVIERLSSPEAKRTPTGTLLGVTSRPPRAVGLPPPAAAAKWPFKGAATSTPAQPGRSPLARTTAQNAAARSEAKSGKHVAASAPSKEAPAALEARPAHATNATLPEGALIGELDLPIDLPRAPSAQPGRFKGFTDSYDFDSELVVPPAPGVSAPLRATVVGTVIDAKTGPLTPGRMSSPRAATGETIDAAPGLRGTASYAAIAASVEPAGLPGGSSLFGPQASPPAHASSAPYLSAPGAVLESAPSEGERWEDALPEPMVEPRADERPHEDGDADAHDQEERWSRDSSPGYAPHGYGEAPSYGSAPRGYVHDARSYDPMPRQHVARGYVARDGERDGDSFADSRDHEYRSRPPHTLDGSVPTEVFDRMHAAQAPDSWRPPGEARYHEDRGRHFGGGTMLLAAAIVVGGFFGYRAFESPGAQTRRAASSTHAAAPAAATPAASAPAPVTPAPRVESAPARTQVAPPAEPVAPPPAQVAPEPAAPAPSVTAPAAEREPPARRPRSGGRRDDDAKRAARERREPLQGPVWRARYREPDALPDNPY